MADTTKQEMAVVVGATGDMGQVIVERLVAGGLMVLAVARSEPALKALAAKHAAVRACAADIAEDAAIEAIRRGLDRPVRMVVHAAGLPPTAMGDVLGVPLAGVAESFAIKPAGMMRLVRAVDDRLVAGSRLVAIGGHLGLEPSAQAANPGMANAALVNLMRQYALVYGKRRITAHLIAPGPTDTARVRRSATRRAETRGVPLDTVLAEMTAESPLGILTTCDQVAWAVAMLLAPEAEAITGSTLMLDAGRRHGLP
ncbi:MAG TPA: SDR family oxidoreductase [Candidatus Sulfotelmatobacter sp.]|nr:SDR family oxidoreductase [Candidatus Sulfotelmatobacter sp.]